MVIPVTRSTFTESFKFRPLASTLLLLVEKVTFLTFQVGIRRDGGVIGGITTGGQQEVLKVHPLIIHPIPKQIPVDTIPIHWKPVASSQFVL